MNETADRVLAYPLTQPALYGEGPPPPTNKSPPADTKIMFTAPDRHPLFETPQSGTSPYLLSTCLRERNILK